jgi:3-hydroxyisobutyrate dehydrogenase-like beta-hydroxyacid dehydrogenase
MGRGIASSLLSSGFDVSVYNRTPSRCAELVELGATACTTPAEAAAQASAVVTSVLDDDAVRDVLSHPDGLLASMPADAVHIATTTVSPELTEWMVAEHLSRGQHVIAAPVAGRPDAAQAGQLLSLVGGPRASVERARPFIDGYSRATLYCGPDPVSATAMKLAFNFFVVGMIELFGEVLAYADAWQLDATALTTAMSRMLRNDAFAGYLDRIGERRFDAAGFELTTGLKDVELMLAAGDRAHVSLPIADVARDHLLEAIAAGYGSADWSALTESARASARSL